MSTPNHMSIIPTRKRFGYMITPNNLSNAPKIKSFCCVSAPTPYMLFVR